ncbi:unnamed protein product [Caenorhabditis auriculariae]|uniref:Alanine--tRNA ligase n=1 Tax=Caenorhabditis auriculariae TaxID=2777116 RepID=A0A8S1HMV0_9PELO|nr:unnamed protein product [Caenorhabditis auriculariae]
MNSSRLTLYLRHYIHTSSFASSSKGHVPYLSQHELRTSFVDYFKAQDHEHVPSWSVVPAENDGSLLFTNAGMNQFKPLILDPNGVKRKIVSVQKCIRAGGKHNDLDDVGSDLHHQTFFEMLGNWSFNNAYSKEEACKMAWDYLCDTLKIDADRLYVSYFAGSEELGISADFECRDVWKKIGVPDGKILPFEKDNFWEMGASGPCGPCTEIHYDRSEKKRDAAILVNRDDSVVELWNLVFMSNLRLPSGQVKKLHSEHIDTGMGFERLLSVVQNVPSNFDTDVFAPIFQRISELSKLQYGGRIGKDLAGLQDSTFRVVADHLRAVTVAIADGAKPAGTDSGFIVRKMLRRACLQSTRILNFERSSISELVPVVVRTLGEAYPKLRRAEKYVIQTVEDEEKQFWKVVDKGAKTFENMLKDVPSGSKSFPGKFLFALHDTYGVSVEITTELARIQGLSVDLEEYERLRNQAKEASKKSSSFGLSLSISDFPTHSDNAKYEYDYDFATDKYHFPKTTSKVLAIYEEGRKVEKMESSGIVVLENCQFYAEEGGQASDYGVLMINDEPVFLVEGVRKHGGVSALFGKKIGKNREILEGAIVKQCIDEKKRLGLMRAHTSTHLLNWALRKVGIGSGQRGSSLGDDSLRFDYATSEEQINPEKRVELLKAVEELVNEKIAASENTFVKILPLKEAWKMEQLQSEFREHKEYPEKVRVCGIGNDFDGVLECCSGTHVRSTKSIGSFVLMGEKSTAKGIRRVTALTGRKAREAQKYAGNLEELLSSEAEQKQTLKIDWDRIPYLQQQKLRIDGWNLIKQRGNIVGPRRKRDRRDEVASSEPIRPHRLPRRWHGNNGTSDVTTVRHLDPRKKPLIVRVTSRDDIIEKLTSTKT